MDILIFCLKIEKCVNFVTTFRDFEKFKGLCISQLCVKCQTCQHKDNNYNYYCNSAFYQCTVLIMHSLCWDGKAFCSAAVALELMYTCKNKSLDFHLP